MDSIKQNLENINKRIKASALRVNRDPDTIKLVAVSKRKTLDEILAAADCGQMHFGENYVQEAQEKVAQAGNRKKICWHYIGHLQTNKAKKAAELFDVIETIDRFKLAKSLDTHLAAMNKNLSVLIQVNIGRESQKSGVLPEYSAELVEQVSSCRHLTVKGLMTITPYSGDPEASRPYFRKLKTLADEMTSHGLFSEVKEIELSMGMTSDFDVAIEEGATIIRVGTAIFGARD